jgi:hypothetical protein
MANQIFLILFAALHEAGAMNSTGNFISKLWEYLVPWQLIGLGFEPEYPEHLQTGRSVLHRPVLIDRLSRRVKLLKDMNVGEEFHSAHFGKAVLIEEKGRQSSLFLTFQTRPKSRDVNVIFLRLPVESEGQTVEVLRGLCREKPFWGESDLTRLGSLSDTVDLDSSVEIMIATHKGARGLWVFDETEHKWKIIGRFDYYTRKRETVTLLMSVTLREDTSLKDLSDKIVHGKPIDLRDIVEVGLGTVSAVFRNCKTVKCRLSIEHDEKMFRVSFLKLKGDIEIAHLSIKRTADVLEVLRRPDFQCQQVVVDGNEMIWNRFRDIDYVGDTRILRPWVERREPFKTVELKIPPKVDQFIQIEKRVGMTLSVHHDQEICPLSAVSQDNLKDRIKQHKDNIKEYLHLIEGGQSQPDEVLTESMYRHGLCWRIELKAEEELPETVKDLERIALSGPSLATILKSGALIYNDKGRWVRHEFEVPHTSSLPREFKESIILVEAYRELVPRALQEILVPGSYLVERAEQWIVSFNFQREAVIWDAQSDTSGETFQGVSFTVLVYPAESLESAKDRVITSVINTLPLDSIRNLYSLKEHVKDMLRAQGHKSRNLYAIKVCGDGDLVKYDLEKLGVDTSWGKNGSVKITEGMNVNEVFESLLKAVDKQISKEEEYELESPDKVKESLAEVMGRLAVEQGWSPSEEKLVDSSVNPLIAVIERGRVEKEVHDCREAGDSEQSLKIMDGYLERMRPVLHKDKGVIPPFVEVLLLKVEVLVSEEITGVVDPEMLLNVLNQVEEYSYNFEPQLLKANTPFAKRIRWALALRKNLRKSI